MINYLSGPSNFWRCPNCQAILAKRAVLDSLGTTVVGVVTCENCGRHHSSVDVYDGNYDLPEVELNCPHCHVLLRGPQEELLGYPCPACNQSLPEARAAQMEELREPGESANIKVYRIGSEGTTVQHTTAAKLTERQNALQENERAVEIMEREGDYLCALNLLNDVRRAIADEPSPMVSLNIAVCHAHLGEFKQSLAVLEEALQHWPDNARLRMNYEAIKREVR